MSSSAPKVEGKTRQRVSLACLACRQKRMRCDGQQPTCGSCTRRGTACEFPHADNKRRPPSKKYVESLQARIRHLEAQVVSLGSQPVPSAGHPNAPGAQAHEQRDASTSSDSDDQGPLADLTGRVGRLTVIDDGQLHYFGSQSSYNLVPSEPARRPSTDSHEPALHARRQGLAAAAQLGKTVAIPDELQDHLLELYWRWQNPWNYVIHKGAFLRSLRGGEHDGGGGGGGGGSSSAYCSPLLLCAVFAIAARYSDRVELRSVPGDSSTAGDAFCEYAKVLMLYESEAPTITTVQAACLLALRIMSDGKEALGWLYAGNATRMAHNLGLHLDCSDLTTTGLVSEEETEVRKVTWWGCYVVDKLFSLGLGRPSSTPKATISCPKPSIDTDEEYTPWLATTDDASASLGVHSHISSTACHVSETFTIACEAMDVIYAANRKLSTHELEDIVSKTDLLLQTHFRELPTYLRLPASSKLPMLPHVCLFQPLIHKKRKRPPSANASTDSTSLSNAPEPENPHMATCRHSATEIARLLRAYKHQHTLRRIPIAAVHLCFSAAVIHLVDARPASPHRAPALRHLQTCVDALRELRTAWCAWSDRAVRAVRLLARAWYQCEDLARWGVEVEVGAAGHGGLVGEGAGGEAAAAAAAAAGGDTLAFLFDDVPGSPDPYLDSLVKSWLAETGYDVLNDLGG